MPRTVRCFVDDDFIRHLERVAVSDDDLPAGPGE